MYDDGIMATTAESDTVNSFTVTLKSSDQSPGGEAFHRLFSQTLLAIDVKSNMM